MAHPKRKRHFPYLREKLGDVPFSIDGGWGIWENCKRAWALHDPSADYHLVVQDDAIICRNFFEEAEKVMLSKPGYAYSFYFGNRKRLADLSAKALKEGGCEMYWISWGVAICLPTTIIRDLPKFCDRLPLRYRKHDDTMIAKYVNHLRIPVWYPVPSLIDHRADEKSLMSSDPGGGRKAYRFLGE